MNEPGRDAASRERMRPEQSPAQPGFLVGFVAPGIRPAVHGLLFSGILKPTYVKLVIPIKSSKDASKSGIFKE